MKERAKKVVTWMGDHSKEILLVGTGLAIIATGVIVKKKLDISAKAAEKILKDAPKCGRYAWENLTPQQEAFKKIDEDIFTIIAPMIEDAVLAEGVDESLFETIFTVPFPKGGDWKNGTYEVLKKVKIFVQDVGDAV